MAKGAVRGLLRPQTKSTIATYVHFDHQSKIKRSGNNNYDNNYDDNGAFTEIALKTTAGYFFQQTKIDFALHLLTVDMLIWCFFWIPTNPKKEKPKPALEDD